VFKSNSRRDTFLPCLYCLLQVLYDPDRVGPRQLIQVVTDLGYSASPIDDTAHVDGSALREKEKQVTPACC
jgi:hypothetical protein